MNEQSDFDEAHGVDSAWLRGGDLTPEDLEQEIQAAINFAASLRGERRRRVHI